MVNLKAKPYYLADEDIKWVEDTISNMTDEEKVGQLFFQLTAGMDEAYLKELMEKYHLGGCRYNNMPAAAVQQQNRILQKYAKVLPKVLDFYLKCSPPRPRRTREYTASPLHSTARRTANRITKRGICLRKLKYGGEWSVVFSYGALLLLEL